MFNKEFGARRGGINANKVHENIMGKGGIGANGMTDNIYKAQISAQTRRMFNEHEIPMRGYWRKTMPDGTTSVGDDIIIKKRNPDSEFYKYGNKKPW